MSDRTFDLLLKQDATGKTLDVRLEQQLPEPKPLTVIELKPDTKETYLSSLTEGSVVDWGDGTESTITAAEAQAKHVKHTYADTSTANRVVTIDGVIDRTKYYLMNDATFDQNALTAVRSLGKLIGSAGALFRNCKSLTTIHAGLFEHCTELTDFNECFDGCSSLTEIPAGLFDHCTEVVDFNYCFQDCPGLTEIPAGLFDHCTKVTIMAACFAGCSSLTAIPAGLFDHCQAVTTFSLCFAGCSSLTEIPAGLFDHCPAVTRFANCFASCSNLTEIPAGLFDHCTEVTSMLACFHECSSLTAIPTGLFDHCTKVVEFYCCFQGCSNLTGETPYTMVDGKKVKLWDRSPENGFANATEKSLMCFSKCGKLSDYAEIPDEWG